MGPYRHILAPTDFSGPSQRAVDAAVELASFFGAKLTVAHVFQIPWFAYAGQGPMPVDWVTPLEETARKLLASALEAVRKRMPDAEMELRVGAPWEETLAIARDVGADLIVMGTHGRSGVAHALIGSVTERVVRHSPIPVLTIRSSTPERTATKPTA